MTRCLALPALSALTLVLVAIDMQAAAEPTGGAPVVAASEHDQRRREELDMLERARAERADRTRPTEDASAAGEDPASDPAEAIRVQAIDAEVKERIQAAEREAELDEVSERIRRSAATRTQAATEPPTGEMPQRRVSAITPLPAESLDEQVTGWAASQSDGRATLLLVMRPGRTGIRALNPTADPIICSTEVCWISRGAEQDARIVPRRKALGALNTLGDRAGACNGSTGCVFRNVELGGHSAIVQPVDLRLIRHDRRAPVEVRMDRTCAVENDRLDCRMQTIGGDYHLWTVPEPVARSAGARALMIAVGAGARAVARRED